MIITEGKRARERRLLREVFDAFRDVAPWVLVEQAKTVKEIKKGIRDKGISKERTVAHIASIEPEIKHFVECGNKTFRGLGLGWFNDSDNLHFFFQEFPDLRLTGK